MNRNGWINTNNVDHSFSDSEDDSPRNKNFNPTPIKKSAFNQAAARHASKLKIIQAQNQSNAGSNSSRVINTENRRINSQNTNPSINKLVADDPSSLSNLVQEIKDTSLVSELIGSKTNLEGPGFNDNNFSNIKIPNFQQLKFPGSHSTIPPDENSPTTQLKYQNSIRGELSEFGVGKGDNNNLLLADDNQIKSPTQLSNFANLRKQASSTRNPLTSAQNNNSNSGLSSKSSISKASIKDYPKLRTIRASSFKRKNDLQKEQDLLPSSFNLATRQMESEKVNQNQNNEEMLLTSQRERALEENTQTNTQSYQNTNFKLKFNHVGGSSINNPSPSDNKSINQELLSHDANQNSFLQGNDDGAGLRAVQNLQNSFSQVSNGTHREQQSIQMPEPPEHINIKNYAQKRFADIQAAAGLRVSPSQDSSRIGSSFSSKLTTTESNKTKSILKNSSYSYTGQHPGGADENEFKINPGYTKYMLDHKHRQQNYLPKFSDEEIVESFNAIDYNRDGFITKDELRFFLEIMDDNYSEEVLEEMISMLDYENLGRVRYEEFFKLASGKDIHPIGLSFPPIFDLFQLMDNEDKEDQTDMRPSEDSDKRNMPLLSSQHLDHKSNSPGGEQQYPKFLSPTKKKQMWDDNQSLKSIRSNRNHPQNNQVEAKIELDEDEVDTRFMEPTTDEKRIARLQGQGIKKMDTNESMQLPLRRTNKRLSQVPVVIGGTENTDNWSRKERDIEVVKMLAANELEADVFFDKLDAVCKMDEEKLMRFDYYQYLKYLDLKGDELSRSVFNMVSNEKPFVDLRLIMIFLMLYFDLIDNAKLEIAYNLFDLENNGFIIFVEVQKIIETFCIGDKKETIHKKLKIITGNKLLHPDDFVSKDLFFSICGSFPNLFQPIHILEENKPETEA